MALGFTLQALLGFIFGGANQQIQKIFPLYIVLYGLFLTLGEVGPGSTVVLTATESFPTSIRGQMMGFVSAWSKAGAAIGTQVFSAIMSSSSFTDPAKADQAAFLIGSSFALVGALIAWFVVPEMSNRLDDEDDAWKAYLAENGWEADWGDQVSRDPSGVKMDRIVS
jgi:MFS family permease